MNADQPLPESAPTANARPIPDAVPQAPGERSELVDAHCLACHAATPAYGLALIARAMTVEASKAYAVLHYRAELDSI